MRVLFFLIFLAIWGGVHVWVAWRLGAGLSAPWQRLAWFFIAFLFGAALLSQLMREMVNFEPVYTIVQWVGTYSMGVFCLLAVLVALKEVGWLLFGMADRVFGGEEGLIDEERRQFLVTGLNAGVVATTAVASKWGFYQAVKMPAVLEVDVPIEGLPKALEGFRIVQISDLHVGPTVRRKAVAEIVARVNELKPDLVAITGDLIEGRVAHIADDVAPILDLKSRHGTFYCTGNHEYYWEALKWCDWLSEHGVVVLNNEHRIIDHEGGKLLVGGCTDYRAHTIIESHRSDPVKAKEGAGPHDASVLLAHQPSSIHEAAKAGFDLQLSGHTHGGQFWPGNLLIDHFHPYAIGLHREDKTWIYVSRGTGYWGPPMRLKAPSEITVVRLVGARSSSAAGARSSSAAGARSSSAADARSSSAA